MNLGALLRGRCPRCGRGEMFLPGWRGFMGLLHETCPVCGMRFMREPGYFLGAMYFSYGLGMLTILPAGVVLAVVLEWSLWIVMPLVIILTLLSMPVFMRLSRSIWLHVDQKLDPR